VPVLDWVFATVLVLSMLLGAWRGLVYELMSLASWLAAFFVAQWLAHDVSRYLPIHATSEAVKYALAFVLVFIATVMLGVLLAVLAKKLLSTVGLRPVDRILGAVFGLTRGLLLLLLVTTVVNITPLKGSAAWQESMGVRVALVVLKGLKPGLPRDLDQYLPA
jgi:membrane protein required for colicin V production